ncbi:MAG: type II toxin-antitoxin system PemK/MazF family toxin [bacterium]|nr:type II toxin-antitoxin system PemK/MazF family toxin [bacterium]
MKVIKRFLEWIRLKEKLHMIVYKPPLFNEGEIWWCSIGENVGSEINGKSMLFSRPILIYKKFSSTTFMGIPTTSQDRKGSWYVEITLGKRKSTIILNQARALDYKRLSSKLGQLDALEMNLVRTKFTNLYI